MAKMKLSTNKRGIIVLLIVLIVAIGLIIRLSFLQIVKGRDYSAKVENMQLSDTEISAGRGIIYDTNMNILARSASTWLVYINPSEINDISDEKMREEVRQIVVDGMVSLLGEDETDVFEMTRKDSSYQVVERDVEKNTHDAILKYIEDYSKKNIELNKIICMDPDVKRYYPYSTLASTIIGFTGTDGDGLAGVENFYNFLLKGVNGRTIRAKSGDMSSMPNQYETIYEAQDGTSLVLTVDIYIQNILEDILKQALDSTKAENIYGIVMDVDNGAILGMVSLPDYDLNSPFNLNSILDQRLEELSTSVNKEDTTTEDGQVINKKYYQNTQWNNRAVTSTYDPGSVFKIVTVSAALEEGVADRNTSYYCSGEIDYAEREIHCWKAGGHGSETFADLLKNSCNPFAVTVADSLGRSRFYDYFEAFGFTEKTGIDLFGEPNPQAGVLYKPRSDFSISDLASYSFGQSFQITPMQMITAVSAIANGGKLMTPYLVAKELNSNGDTISETQPNVRRQVISESTASVVRELMRQVVSDGTGKNAYVAGYNVAGKTGTSEKLRANQNKDPEDEKYVASFCGFAPADDPKISVMIVVDEPEGEHGGGAVAAPLAGEIFEQVLTYMGVKRSYSDSELVNYVERAPSLTGYTVSEAKTLAGKITVDVIGSGNTVVAQYPEAGKEMPADGIIVVYTESDYSESTVIVPDFMGYTMSEANAVALRCGLNIRILGNSDSSGTVKAYKQSVAPGLKVSEGEVIAISFKTTVDVND